jgi:hypothetical protein
MLRKLMFFVAILALPTMACGFTINTPEPIQPGPEVTEKINIPYPDADETRLALNFGAGELFLAPGAEDLVEGTATYNYEQVKPQVTTDGGNVQIKMGETHLNFLPSYNNLKNEWNFKLGSQPVDLSIESGAYKGEFEFGGLALTSLTIKDGAADVNLSFSEPNTTEMSLFQYSTGASNIKLTGLANANFSLFNFSSGAGDYTLDFSGELQRDAFINIETGMSNLIIIVPEGVNAVVTVESGLSNISAGRDWSKNGDVYKQAGEGPTLTFVVEMGMGNLTITK